MSFPCPACNRDDGLPLCLGDARCQRTDGVAIRRLASVAQVAPKPTPDQMVLVNAGALQMVMNALRRDADKGMQSRAEMLAELATTVRQMDARAPDLTEGQASQVLGALVLARDGYVSEATTGRPVLESWREATVRKINVAIDAVQRLRA